MFTIINLTDTRVSCTELDVLIAEINRLELSNTEIRNENGILYANVSDHFTEGNVIIYRDSNNELVYQYTDIETSKEFQYDTIGELLVRHQNVEVRPAIN